jgi:hypothetical protein
MKKTIKIIYLSLLLLLTSCLNKNNISDKVNDLILKDKNLYKDLTTSYHFKVFNDGVTKDLSKPEYSDSIIILKNKYSDLLELSHINNGKCKLLDSIDICKLSLNYDKNRIVMKKILIIETDGKQTKLISTNWLPQYSKPLRFIELFKDTLLVD